MSLLFCLYVSHKFILKPSELLDIEQFLFHVCSGIQEPVVQPVASHFMSSWLTNKNKNGNCYKSINWQMDSIAVQTQ